MSRQQISDLRPGTGYQIQVRSVASDSVSEWSRVFLLTTMIDNVKPKVVQNVTWVSSGDSYHAEWDVITQNTNAENINIDHYDLELVSGATTRVVTVAQGAARMSYDLSFEANRALFTTPQGSITLRVRAVDNKGLYGDWTLPITATNAAPNPVTGLTGTPVTDSVFLKWTAPADTDLAGYNLYVGAATNPSTKINNKPITSTEYNFQTTTYSLQYFKVTAVDKFGQESSGIEVSTTPVSPFALDTTAPSTPTALAATITNNTNGIGASAAVSWTMSSPPTDLAGFYVRYRKVGDTFYTNTTFQSADRAGTIALPLAYTNYEFQIKSFDWSNNESAWSGTYTAVAPGAGTPTTVSALSITTTPGGLRFAWSAVPETNIKYYELQIATNSGMTTGIQTFNTGVGLYLNVNGLSQNTAYWAQVRAVNVAGTAGAWGPVSPATATTLKYNDVITVTADIIQPGTLGAGTIDIGAGATLRTNGGAIKSNTFDGTFTSGTYNNNATAGYYLDSTNGLVVKTGKISADALVAGTISGTNQIILSGANAKITGGTWELSGNGLSIPDGGIIAQKINLQNGQNLVPPLYASFEASGIYSNAAGSILYIIQGGMIVGNNGSGKFGNKSIGTIWNTNTMNPILALARTDTDYNIPVEGGKTYIFSIYTWVSGAVPTNVQMKVRWSDGSYSLIGGSTNPLVPSTGYALSTTQVSTNAASAVRLAGYATAPAGVTACQVAIESNTWTAFCGFNLDGLQVEEKLTYSDGPSSWTPPGATSIAGDQITTGTIKSTSIASYTVLAPTYDGSGAVNGNSQVSVNDPNGALAWSIDTAGDAKFANLDVVGDVVVGPPTGTSTTFPFSVNVTTTSGSNSITINPVEIHTGDIGDIITGTGIPASTTITAVSGTTATLSANATASGTIVANLFKPVTYTSSIASSNYIPGSQGWKIRSDGFAEFQQMTANSINVNAIASGNYSGEIALVEGGKIIARGTAGAVWMDATGFYSKGYDGSGNATVPFIEFPNTGAPNIVSGKLISQELIINGDSVSGNGATFNQNNYINTNSTLTALGAVQPPSATLVSKSWPNVPLTITAGTTVGGLSFSSGSYRSVMLRANAETTTTTTTPDGTYTTKLKKMYIQYNTPATGGAQSSNIYLGDYVTYESGPITGRIPVGSPTSYAYTYTLGLRGISRLEGATPQVLVLYNSARSGSSAQADHLYASVHNADTGAWIAGDNIWGSGNGLHSANGGDFGATSGTSNWNIAVDYVNNRWLYSYMDSAQNLVVKPITVSGSNIVVGAAVLTIAKTGTNGHNSNSIATVGYGPFDFGSGNHYVFRDATNLTHVVYSAAGVIESFAWPTAIYSGTSQLTSYSAWDTNTSRWRQLDTAAWRLYEYAPFTNGSGTTFNDGSLKKNWNVKGTYYRSGSGYETGLGAISTTLEVYNRSQVTVTLAQNIPYSASSSTSPDSVRLWVDKSGTGTGTYQLMGTIVQPSKTVTYAGSTFPLTAWSTPATSFPSGGAGLIQSSVAGWALKGDGTWNLGTLTNANTDTSGGYTNFVVGGIRIQSGNIAQSVTTATTWTFNITFPTAFSAAPIVMVNAANSSASNLIVWGHSAATTTGFVACAEWNDKASHSTSGAGQWIAIGPA